ncbi:13168_t:CDS:2 [Ambispora gerdemannii]|uniref:13168_t:CDS:1 n=1 Tax=Ambispora gerdemannii TaxID=144530 RepID=A0A9N9F2W4_9GLOM|nr:13168_t:CDS:2 [Ambispora gerdemannii]
MAETTNAEGNATIKAPYWGQGTSTLDWCEVILLSLFGIYTTVKYNLGKRYIVAHLALCSIGIGSWFFHMTLWFEFQLLDELPMLYATSVLLYNIYEIYEKPKYGTLIPFTLFTYAATVTVLYLYNQEPVFHQVAYAFLVSALHIRSVYLLQQVENVRTRNQLKFLLFGAAVLFGTGFLLWNVDNIACSQLRRARMRIGKPLAHFLELHGWWHILTASGSYWWMVYNQYVRVVLLGKQGKQQEWQISWGLGLIPYVSRILQIDLKNE